MKARLGNALLICVAAYGTLAGQQPKPSPEVDVIRIDTELVQTAVAVFDKRGNFVDKLSKDDFELKVNGKIQVIPFFTRVTAGTNEEQNQFAAARKGVVDSKTAEPLSIEQRGRTVIFFMDDLHMSAESVRRIRETILRFLDTQMGPDDEVAVASASGQIGFLQQFTDNKAVLRAAVARLNHRPYTVVDSENIPMTEYQALRVDQGDGDAITYYTNQLLAANNFKSVGGAVGPPSGGGAVASSRPQTQRSGGLSRDMAERMVKERALVLLKQATAVTTSTLSSLESLMRTSADLPGRKLVFLVSDGFFLNDRNTGFMSKVQRITDAAVRAGVVVYSLDTRGLTNTVDVMSNRVDPEGKLSRSNVGEKTASQDALNALAENTGGRALFDSDKLSESIDRGLRETSNYYLLSWKPTSDDQKASDFRKIEISVAGRPELVVRIPKGFFQSSPTATAATSTAEVPAKIDSSKSNMNAPSETELRAALTSANTKKLLPTTVAASWVDAPGKGPLLTASVQTSSTALNYGADNKQAAVAVAGIVLNDQGKVAASFRTRMTVNPLPENVEKASSGVVYSYKTPLSPGLYQIRAAVRDEKSGKVGSATQWIEIPDLTAHPLTLSSLLLRGITHAATAEESPSDLQFSVDRHFSKSSQLNFFIFIYNAKKSTADAPPTLAAQVEVLRNGASVISTTPRPLSTSGMTDLARIPYSGQFPLTSLAQGRYHLKITIFDKLANTSVSQRLSFLVE